MYLELHSLGAESANLIKLLPVPWFDNKVEFGIAHRDPRGAAWGGQVVERGTRPRPTVVKWAECARRGRCQGVHGPETPGTSRSVDSGSFHMGRAGLTFGPSGGARERLVMLGTSPWLLSAGRLWAITLFSPNALRGALQAELFPLYSGALSMWEANLGV